MKKLSSFLAGTIAAIALIAGLSYAQTLYYGWNSSTGLETTHGALISGGAQPTLSGCATISSSAGGASSGKFVTSGTSCNLVITFPAAAPNGWFCEANDLTTTSDKVVQSATTTTTATFSGTTVASDTINWHCFGY